MATVFFDRFPDNSSSDFYRICSAPGALRCCQFREKGFSTELNHPFQKAVLESSKKPSRVRVCALPRRLGSGKTAQSGREIRELGIAAEPPKDKTGGHPRAARESCRPAPTSPEVGQGS